MYLALARKYRPKSFADVAVQSHVSNTLKGAIARGRVAHGYLLCGPRGVGKTTLARVLAMALNCERERARRRALWGVRVVHAHLERLAPASTSSRSTPPPTAASTTRASCASARCTPRPARSGYKVYIVDEAHMLTREAWNALLKILEEPPPRVVFVFATTEPQKIAQAAAPVLSRLQRFDFKRIGAGRNPGAPRDRPRRGRCERRRRCAGDDRARRRRLACATHSRSPIRCSRWAKGGVTAERRSRVRSASCPRTSIWALLELIAERRAADVFPTVGRLADSGIDFGRSSHRSRRLAARAARRHPRRRRSGRIGANARGARDRRDRFTAADLLRMLRAIAEIEPHFPEERPAAAAARDPARALRVARPHGRARRSASRRLAMAAVARRRETAAAPRGTCRLEAPRPTPPGARSPCRAAQPLRSRSDLALADAPQPARTPSPRAALDLNVLCERWGDVIVDACASGRTPRCSCPRWSTRLLSPCPRQGTITVQLEQPNEIFAADDREWCVRVLAVARVRCSTALRSSSFVASSSRPLPRRRDRKRLTEDQARRERAATVEEEIRARRGDRGARPGVARLTRNEERGRPGAHALYASQRVGQLPRSSVPRSHCLTSHRRIASCSWPTSRRFCSRRSRCRGDCSRFRKSWGA